MADYYPLIARAVSGLDKSTGEARRALYERARTALVAQLRGVTPALSEADITQERLALEDAIRKVETEAARRSRVDAPKAETVPTQRPGSPPPAAIEPRPAPSPPRNRSESPRQSEPSRSEAPQPESPRTERPPEQSPPKPALPKEPSIPAEPVMPKRRADKHLSGDRPSLMDQGLKGFRNVMAETNDLGEAAASASKSARDAFAAFPPASRDPDRVEPRFNPEEFLPTPRELPSPKPHEPPPTAAKWRSGSAQPHSDDLEEPPPSRHRLRSGFDGGIARKLVIGAMLIVLVGAAAVAYRQWPSIAGVFQALRGPATQAAKDTTQARPKISDRIGGSGQQDSSAQPGGNPAAAVAQRVVLFEAQPNTQERKQYIGSVIWRTETVSPGPGLPTDVAIKAQVEIPERHIRMSFVIRREQTPAASHTIEILFSTPADFPPGSITDVPGVLMDQAEQARGAPLAGLRIEVAPGFFLIGLSPIEAETRRNVQLLKERAWLHLPVVYKNGSRALLAIEKGVPGDRVFEEAFAAWKQ